MIEDWRLKTIDYEIDIFLLSKTNLKLCMRFTLTFDNWSSLMETCNQVFYSLHSIWHTNGPFCVKSMLATRQRS